MIIINKIKKLIISNNIKSLVDKNIKDNERIRLSLMWFKNSLNKEGGSSAGYDLLSKTFLPSYPETTGYWIKTLFRIKKNEKEIFFSIFNDDKIIEDLVLWLLSIQKIDGSFPGSYGKFESQPSIVFNNGQILLGLIDYYINTKNDKVFNSIIKCAEWLLDIQETNGSWIKNTHYQYSSNTRTAWALMHLGSLVSDKKYYNAGINNINYSIDLQNELGIFEKNGFDEQSSYYTHTIAYAIRGVLESGIIDNNEEWILSAKKGFDILLNSISDNGFLSGKINNEAMPQTNYSCLVGNCQLSIIGFKIYKKYGDPIIKEKSTLLLDYVRRKQIVSENKNTSGGILGSWPIDGYYNSYRIPNWSGKFFIDALLLNKIIQKR